MGDRFKFTGRELDAETGLYNYRARYYSPTLGVFVSEDPLGFCGGDDNLRAYVSNRPTNATDPSGMQAIGEFGATLAFQLEIVTTLFEFGGDDPYTFRVGRQTRQAWRGLGGGFSLKGPIAGGVGGNLNVTNPGASGPTYSPVSGAIGSSGDEGIVPWGAGKVGDAAWDHLTTPPEDNKPFGGFEFQFLVESTAYEKSYFDHFLARFNVAIFGGVAEELNFIAKYAVTDDSSTLVEVHDQQGIWEAHGFATRTPTKPDGGSGPLGPPGSPPPPDGGFGFGGSGPPPGPGNPPDGDDDDGDDGDGGDGCCGGAVLGGRTSSIRTPSSAPSHRRFKSGRYRRPLAPA